MTFDVTDVRHVVRCRSAVNSDRLYIVHQWRE